MAEHDERREVWRVGMAPAWGASRKPDDLAVTSPHGERTFAELNHRANQVVRALRARGLAAGDAVALMSRNRPEWIEVYAACLRAGWRLTPVNWHLTAAEAAYVIEDCEASAVVPDV
jgi:long-chain acyl-CoA synthetase